jgi:hypothetical protein
MAPQMAPSKKKDTLLTIIKDLLKKKILFGIEVIRTPKSYLEQLAIVLSYQ